MGAQDLSNGRASFQRPFAVGGIFDASRLDAFGRLRISGLTTIFDSKQLYDNAPLYFDDATVSGTAASTYLTNKSATAISVSSETAGMRVRQTKRRFNYQPAKSQLIYISHILGSLNSVVRKRLGFFDEKNGIFYGTDGNSLHIGVRSYTTGVAVDSVVQQSSWNLDRLDGTTASGITLDPTCTNILVIDFEWLGVGSVRLGFVINGILYYVHQFNHANVLDLVYMTTPNLPLRFEIENDGSGPEDTLTHICCSVSTEGGRDDGGTFFGINRETSALVIADANIHPVLGLRLKSTHLGAFIRLLNFTTYCTSSAEYAWYVILTPTETGTAASFSSLSNSSVEYCIGNAGTVLTGGTILYTGVASDTNSSRNTALTEMRGDITIGSNIDGTRDTIYLAIRRLSGGSETFYAALNFQDIM